MRSDLDKFEDKLIPEPNSGCWLWTGEVQGSNKHKYGYMRFEGRRQQANRISLKLYRGGIPEDMQANHRCNNTYCVNPDHIYVGTQSDNMEDRRRAGRQSLMVGSAHAMAKLNEDKVREIKTLLSTGKSANSISKLYGVAKIQILRIKRGEGWTHVTV